MGYKISCRDAGKDCDFSASADTKEELLEKCKKHGMENHDMTEEDFKNPELMEKMNSAIKED